LNIHKACWVENLSKKNDEFNEFKKLKNKFLAKDKNGKLVFLSDSSFSLEMTKQKFPSVKFHYKSEF
ncbi:MAG: peptide chain release factor 3, partial [Flavobacteriaceae bacterium]|nr:peptide chain release factor 3 [Flavobacteriaceae bacterium]